MFDSIKTKNVIDFYTKGFLFCIVKSFVGELVQRHCVRFVIRKLRARFPSEVHSFFSFVLSFFFSFSYKRLFVYVIELCVYGLEA